MDKIKLAIEEEYGYQHWVAYLTKDEYDELIARWKTISGLHCLVPVRLIIPQAELALSFEDINIWQLQYQGAKRASVHEHDDSFLEGATDYIIPEAEHFSMGGKEYTREEIDEARRQDREYCDQVYASRRGWQHDDYE